jgi:polar amino acid transport system substrate-binding protein
MGDFTLLQWLNSFIFFNTMNGELDKLHQKWLGASMQPLPTL